MHILDTDTLSHLHRGNRNVIANLQSLADPDVVTTIITKIELLRGRFDYAIKAASGADLLHAHQLLARTEELLAQLPVIPWDVDAAVQFDALRARPGLGDIGRGDLLIASIALAHRAVLVTRNVRHFRQVPGLVVVNWVD